MTWHDGFQWKEFTVHVVAPRTRAASVLKALNPPDVDPDAAFGLLAFPVFHANDDGKVWSTGQVFNDPWKLAACLEHLRAISRQQPRWTFEVHAWDLHVFSFVNGAVTQEDEDVDVEAFLLAAEANPRLAFAGVQPLRFTVRMETDLFPPESPARAGLQSALDAVPRGSLLEEDGTSSPVASEWRLNLVRRGFTVDCLVTLRGLRAVLQQAGHALVGCLMTVDTNLDAPLEIEVFLAGRNIAHAASALELSFLAGSL